MNSFRSSFLLYVCVDLVYIYFVCGLIILDLVWRVQAVKNFFTTSNYSSRADLSVLWKSYTIAKQANLVIVASESRSIKQPSNIYVDAGRYQRPRYLSLQHYAAVEELLLGLQEVYFTFNGKRVHLHELCMLPPETTVRVVCYPLKGGCMSIFRATQERVSGQPQKKMFEL